MRGDSSFALTRSLYPLSHCLAPRLAPVIGVTVPASSGRPSAAGAEVRYLGHSNFCALARSPTRSTWRGSVRLRRRPSARQNRWSLLERQAGAATTSAACLAVQQTPAVTDAALPYYPLANGLLTGKVRRGQAPPAGSRLASREGYITEPKLDRVEALERWAAEHGVSLLDVAIGGLAALPGCASVIAGATSPDQVKANAAAADWIPPQDALAGLDQIVPPPDSAY